MRSPTGCSPISPRWWRPSGSPTSSST